MLLNRKKEIPFVDDPEIAQKIEQRLVELLFKNSEPALYALMALSIGIGWISAIAQNGILPAIWVLGYNGLMLCRILHVRTFLRKPEYKIAYQSQVKIFWISAILTSLFWSGGLFLFMEPESSRFLNFYALLTGGIACIAITSLSYIPRIYPSYLVGVLLPISVYFLMLGGLEHALVGYLAFLFIGYGVVLSRRYRRNVIRAITLELNNVKLVETLQKENSKAQKLNSDLRLEVGKRERTESKLMISIDEARAASKAKSDFLAVISHEIRTPMNGILGMLDLVTETGLDKVQQDYIETANHSAETLLRLLNDLLDFSKTEQGVLSLEQRVFSLRETAKDIVLLMAGRAKKKGLGFAFEWCEGAPNWVSGDPIRFRQILGNLVGNAVKFTEEGEIKVSLERFRREDEDIRYFFKVEDTGIGITPESRKTLFDPFTQADSSMTRKYGGSGLGLAISRQLIQMMGGDIDLTSEENKGSCFSFSLAFKEAVPEESQNGNSISAAQNPEQLFSGKVLVVEDDPVNQRVIRLLLERAGLDITISENGQLGFNHAITEAWDIIFMDCQMPVKDGITATREIRSYEEKHNLSRTPIIALTANAKDADRQACKDAGMDGFLAKPLRKADLLSVLETWTPNKGAHCQS